jgi:hypothetical protein
MKLRNGRVIHKMVKDSWGEEGYVFWVENSHFPTFYFVRGESWDDAYDWFLCDPIIEDQIKLEEQWLADYIEGWDKSNGVPGWEEFAKAMEEGRLAPGVTVNDNGVAIQTEAVHGMSLEAFAREFK